MFRKILVPLDGSSFGEHSLPVALSLARRTDGEIHVLHVHNLLEATYAELQVLGDTLDARLRQDEQKYVQDVAQRLCAAGARNVQPVVQDGNTAPTVRSYAVQVQADVIVLTTHARGALGRFWLGSVTDEVLRDTPCPLLLIHPNAQAADMNKEVSFKRVLVPLDGTPLAEQILAPATALAEAFQADFDLLRVLQPILPTTVPVGMGTLSEMAHHMADDLENIQNQMKREASDYLHGVAERLRGQGFKVRTHIAEADQPGVAILEEAKKSGADVIALETHGRRGLSRLILGSVADKVLRGSHLPLLVHKPKH